LGARKAIPSFIVVPSTSSTFYPRSKWKSAIRDDNLVDQVIEAIEKSANTGKIGDGKIFVFDLLQKPFAFVPVKPVPKPSDPSGALPMKNFSRHSRPGH
jgi:hypothetical protein